MKLLSILIVFVSCYALAQPEHQNWHFGSNVGVSFATGNPVLFSGSQIVTQESCYTQSDASGNVMFYTNGIDVWTSANTLMPNGSGLLGNVSSQCMVIPVPLAQDRFYIFTNGAAYDPLNPGLTYSEVDMTLNGGLGDIVPTVKNVPINPENGEWLSAVPHSNCIDYWIITHGYSGNSNFLAYLLTSNGVSPTPVVTNLGINITDSTQVVGVMKPSPAGDKIAMTRPYTSGDVYLMDFDKSTGVASNLITLSTTTGFDWGYGVEFSRSGGKLYYSQFSPPRIFQFDMTAANIPASKTQVGAATFSGEMGQIQIAPNDKIYVSYNVFAGAANFIGVINNPEILGAGCGYVQNGFSLGTGSSVYGLPWYFNKSTNNVVVPDLGDDVTLCVDSNLVLDPQVSTTGNNFLWSTGSTSPTISVSDPGTYWVDVQVGSCAPRRDSMVVAVDNSTIDFQLSDTSGCVPVAISLDGNGSPGVFQWLWSFGDGNFSTGQNVVHEYDTPGVYDLTLGAISINGCPLDTTLVDAISVFSNPSAEFSFNPTIPELGEEIFFLDESTGGIETWSWSAGNQEFSNIQDPIFNFSQGQNLQIRLTVTDSNNCSDSHSEVISFQVEDLIYVPNSFTPNGDGINDVFTPSDIFGILYSMEIYNRWGELIWQAEQGNFSWDGNYRGETASDGIYTWKIKTIVGEIVRDEIVGHVTLIR